MSEINNQLIRILIDKCRNYLRGCLEYWASQGYDHEGGGYFEGVDLEGEPLTTLDRRLRVQARNIFSHAAATLAGYGDFTAVAESGFAYVNSHYRQETGFATLVDFRGQILNPSIFAYDHAFMLLALGWLTSLTGKAEHRQGLDDIWNFIQNYLRNDRGGVYTSSPHPEPNFPFIEQNPHMHLFEALLDIHILTGEGVWLKEASKIYSLYQDYFYNDHDRLIREFFNKDYTPYIEKEWVDPGHHYEWTWLLNKYEKLSGEKTVSLNEIFHYGEIHVGKWGLAYEFLLPDGTVVKSTHRMWAQTEQIKAQLTLYERTGKISHFKKAVKSVETFFKVFCHPDIPGVWYDCFDEEGSLVSKKSPASTLYHLYVGFQEFIRVGEGLLKKN